MCLEKVKPTYGILEVETQEGGCSETIIISGIKTLEELLIMFRETAYGKSSWHKPPRHNCNYYMIVEEI